MSTIRQVPWLRVLVEGAVIVVSILLAFGIDAWWDERQERRDEAEYLAGIVDEMDQNLQATESNAAVWERSYTDLLRARTLHQAALHVDSAGTFLFSLNRGLIYGVPLISTAVFDDLTNSGRAIVIRDLAVRRLVLDSYAGIEAELRRFERPDDAALDALMHRYTPPGLFQQVGPRLSVNESAIPAAVLRSAARAVGADPSFPAVLNAELRRREIERAFLDNHIERLNRARLELAQALDQL